MIIEDLWLRKRILTNELHIAFLARNQLDDIFYLQLRICVRGYVLLMLVPVKQLLSFKKFRQRTHLAVHLKQPR